MRVGDSAHGRGFVAHTETVWRAEAGQSPKLKSSVKRMDCSCLQAESDGRAERQSGDTIRNVRDSCKESVRSIAWGKKNTQQTKRVAETRRQT